MSIFEEKPKPSLEYVNKIDQGCNSGYAEIHSAKAEEITIVATDDDRKELSRGSRILALLSCFVIQNLIMAQPNGFGVYQTYYLVKAFPKSPAAAIAWIGTLLSAGVLVFPVLGSILLNRIGPRKTMFIGVVISALAMLLASFSTQIWQLALTQGLLYSVGSGITFITAYILPGQYFPKMVGFMTGISVGSCACGGAILSVITQVLLDKLGLGWTLRITALMIIVIGSPCCWVLKAGAPNASGCDLGVYECLKRAWKSRDFWLIAVELLFSSMCYFFPFYNVQASAEQFGIKGTYSSILVFIIALGAAVGPVIFGYVADFFGPINTSLVSMLIATISQFTLWLYGRNFSALASFAFLFGVFATTYYVTYSLKLAHYFDSDMFVSLTGFTSAFQGIGILISSPLLGKAYDDLDHRSIFYYSIIISGILSLLATLVCVLQWVLYKGPLIR